MDDPEELQEEFLEAQLGANIPDSAFGMDPVSGNIPLTMQSPAIQSYLLQQSLQNGGQLHQGARLLPPDHFMRSSIGGAGDGPLSPHVASQASTLQNGALNSLLMNVDISTSNFSRAINFEALSDGQNQEHLTGDHGGRQEEELEDYSEAGDSSCVEQDLDVSNTDLFEQQQAREQARLLERFHQLRQWQQQQQQALVQQQQQQLQKLQGEQHRIQQMITKQRQMQWGGGVAKNGIVNQPPPQSPPKSPKKSTKRTSSLPHAIAQSSLQVAMAKANALRTDDLMTQQPMESTPVKKGRPLPNLCPEPPTPVEYLENGNPYLDSDSATLDSRSNHTDEGVRPLLEPTGSEAHAMGGVLPQRGVQGGMMMPQNLSQLPRGNVVAPPPPQNVPFASYHTGGDPSGVAMMQGQYMQNGQLFYDQRRNGDVAVNVPGRTVVMPRMTDSQDYGVDGDLDYRVEEEEEEAVADEEEEDDAEDGEIEEFDERHAPALSQESLQENAHSQGPVEDRSSSPENFDDKPVGGRQKTFEELLEEELRKEEERVKEQADTPTNNLGSAGRKCFLKKGEGVARYGIQLPKPVSSRASNAKQPVQPKPKQSQSHPHSKQSQTKPSTNGGLASKTSTHHHALKKLANGSGSTGKKTGHTSAQPQEKLQLKPSSSTKKKSPQQTQLSQNKQEKKKNTSKATTGQTANPTEEPQSVKDSVAETSFHKNIKQLEKKEKVEEKELEEFELLEQYADDNASFLSNVSAVNRVLQEKQQQLNRLPVHQNDNRRLLASANQHQQQQQLPLQQMEEILADTDGDADSLDSDTESASSESEDDSEDDIGGMESGFSPNARGQNSVQRKTVSLNSRPTTEQQSPLNKVQHFSDSETTAEEEEEEDEEDEDDNNDDDDDEEEEEEDARERTEFTQQGRISNIGQVKGHRPDAQSSAGHQQQQHLSKVKGHSLPHYTQVQTSSHQSNAAGRQHGQFSQGHKNPPAISHHKVDERQTDGGRWSSQTTEDARLNHNSENRARVETFQSEEEEEDSDKENVPSPTEQDKSDNDLQSPSRSRDNVLMRAIDFEDEEEWDDTLREDEDTPVKVEQQRAPPSEGKRSAFTKVKVNVDGAGKNAAAHDEESVPRAETPPPTSKLVSKLFPKLKPDKPKTTVQQTQQLEQAKKVEVGDAVQSQALREKLAELEREIQRFREENTTLAKLRKEREEALEHIKHEMSELEKQKSEELQRLQDFKNEETKRLKRERKQFEQYQKATRAIPDKRDRREIEELKAQLAELHEEVKRKEQRWTANTTRLRDRIEILESENAELKQELKIVEKKRLEAWQHKDVVLRKENVLKVAAARVASHQPKKMTPPPAKPATGQSSQIPRPESQPRAEHQRPLVEGDNDLTLSTNLENSNPPDILEDEAPLGRPAMSAPTPATAGAGLSGAGGVGGGGHLTSSPISNHSGPEAETKKVPRKKAVALSISRAVDKGDEHYEEKQHQDGKVERIYTNGAREILFPNGTRKQISADGQSIIVSFFNGDIKQILPDQRVVYYYSDAQTTHTTYSDGLEILQFQNNQVEKHYPDGTKEITFPDQTIKYLFPNGTEESIFADGTVIRIEKNGNKTMEFPNGQREIHTTQYKKREYPDGTVKTVYPDGRQETRYSSGRIRVKDREGNIIVDRRM